MLEIYQTDAKNRYRYSLGTRGEKTLYVIGLNPSTADNKKLDPTLRSVKSFSEILGFDGFIMLNLYPQRSTLPKGLHKRAQKAQVQKNLQTIKKHITQEKSRPKIWAAWGDPIKVRPYLFECLAQINEALKKHNPHWLQYDELTKLGHPRHPTRKKLEDRFQPFDVETYLNQLKG